MKKLFFFGVFTFVYAFGRAQKPAIDLNVNSWGGIGNYIVSNNGQYIAYVIIDSSDQKLMIKSTLSAWRITIPRAEPIAITQDSKRLVFWAGHDSVGILDLNSANRLQYLNDVQEYSLIASRRNGDYLLYRVTQRPDQLVTRNLRTGEEKTYFSVKSYWSGDNGNVIVLEMNTQNTINGSSLNWIDIGKNKIRTIWDGSKVGDVKIGHSESECVFTANSRTDSSCNSIWFYHDTDSNAVEVVGSQLESLKGMIIKNIVSFNDQCGRIFFNVGLSNRNTKVATGSSLVDVWSYKDSMLQSEQLARIRGQKGNSANYKVVFNLADKRVIRLEVDNEHIVSKIYNDRPMKYVLQLKDGGGSTSEWNWNRRSLKSVFLVDLNNGNKQLIADSLPEIGFSYILSFNENYIFYYNFKSHAYFSYKIRDGTRKNLTIGISAHWLRQDRIDEPDSSYIACGISALVKYSDAILVYDESDIFELDPTDDLQKNLTSKYRKGRDLVFRIAPGFIAGNIDRSERFCVSVFNRTDKSACLAEISIDNLAALGSLNLAPYDFNYRFPIRAQDKELYVVTRQSAEKSPNLYFTTDFSRYVALTNVHPEQKYNWMKTELVAWKTFDGTMSQGILYEPENFDKNKKYPLLIYYYERMSDNLHRFIYPGLSDGLLNIPYYVSHGYLVFTPDIHYKVGRPGHSAYNCVVSGVKNLLKRRYIESKKMGLQGHSFGGFETNYIITHTKLFAAAMSASGMSDFVSAYGSVIGNGTSRQRQYELYRDRIGATLWARPDLYLENSPVFEVNKVTTPILMMANYKDGDVPYQQGVEFFTALRRLGKKAWMLQYDGEGHQVFGRAAQEDLTRRMAQFFGYYLKGELAPKWMTIGIPAKLKGVETGFEVDTTGTIP